MFEEPIDVKENTIVSIDFELLSILLKDRTTGKNIIWATDNYLSRGSTYKFNEEITPHKIIGYSGRIIRPRISKNKLDQEKRIKEKAEVFTPSWVCNLQNNLIDEQWFGYSDVFNKTKNSHWITNKHKIKFPENKSWETYVKELRMEISCGEAPYLVSRYDTVSGEIIDVNDRIGLLDRKIRVINENIEDESEWMNWIIKAYKSIYGYEWQGDNLLLARENLLYTFIDNYRFKFDKMPTVEQQKEIATIISWNLWQMDGVKYTIPNSCKNQTIINYTLFGEEIIQEECYGCKKNNYKRHNGIYCKIMNWETNRKVTFYRLIERGMKNER